MSGNTDGSSRLEALGGGGMRIQVLRVFQEILVFEQREKRRRSLDTVDLSSRFLIRTFKMVYLD